jgi:hypothetical protein
METEDKFKLSLMVMNVNRVKDVVLAIVNFVQVWTVLNFEWTRARAYV